MENASFTTNIASDTHHLRPFECACGKNYKSYPALYTHIKNKHEGKVLQFRYSPLETSKKETLTIEKEVALQFEIDLPDHRPSPKVQKEIYQLQYCPFNKCGKH
jgi:hypothetical protein